MLNSLKAIALLTLMSMQNSWAAPAGTALRLAYVGASTHDSLDGARQGLDEANLQGRFLGQDYALDIVDIDQAKNTDFSPYIAVIAAVAYADFIRLGKLLPRHPLFNVALSDDRLRGLCLPNALHVIPSERMLADAVKQWRQKQAGANVRAQAWDPRFVKFAARDLNKRFKKQYGRPMDDYAWAGWAAVKMVSDSAVRGDLRTAAGMLAYLRNDLAFDGQKGVNMSFRETGQLRQLLLLVEDGKLVAEAPVRGVADVSDLDSLGRRGCEGK